MAIYQINGVDMPSPSELEIAYKVKGKAELAASGDTVMDRLSIKRILTITYNHAYYNHLISLIQALIGGEAFVEVSYVEPYAQAWVTGTYRMTDLKLPAMQYSSLIPARYKSVRLVLEER